ncbi:MAG TPA: MAPEG family protein [Stellaceae bacterium]|nr:MAPEG family protein [Stellaceae bacterium]HYL49457.1 MAPEG family protein [Stellaceae bacterium]
MFAHALLVSPLYVGLCALIFVALSARVIRGRRRRGVNLGHGGHGDLETAIRIHANFAEYVPLALLIIVLVEATGFNRYWVHALGVALVAGRLLHAWGLAHHKQPSLGRIVGVTLTFAVLAIGGALLIVHVVGTMVS